MGRQYMDKTRKKKKLNLFIVNLCTARNTFNSNCNCMTLLLLCIFHFIHYYGWWIVDTGHLFPIHKHFWLLNIPVFIQWAWFSLKPVNGFTKHLIGHFNWIIFMFLTLLLCSLQFLSKLFYRIECLSNSHSKNRFILKAWPFFFVSGG